MFCNRDDEENWFNTTDVNEVFDPTLPIPSWKVLPHEPNPDIPGRQYFAWGHKILTFPEVSIFDAKSEKWEGRPDFVYQFTDKARMHFPIGAAVEFKGIVFAVSMYMNALVACDLDASGTLNAHWVLDELSEVFKGPPIHEPWQGFLTHIGGGRMCLLFSGDDKGGNWIIRVQVFQVSITTVGDRPDRPEVNREIMRTFDLRSWNGTSLIESIFMCDHSNKSDIEADASSGSYSCEDLKKRAGHPIDVGAATTQEAANQSQDGLPSVILSNGRFLIRTKNMVVEMASLPPDNIKGLWCIILLRAYGKITDRRMGIHGHPLEIQALFYSALRCSREMIIDNNGSRNLVRAINNRLRALSFHIREYYWVDIKKINEIYRYKTEEYSHVAINKFNFYPEQIPAWLVEWVRDEGGYLIGNLQPTHMDFLFFSLGNIWAVASSLATPTQAQNILSLIEAKWDDLIGEMPLKICYPALEYEEWRIITGSDPKNTPWSYHNGGSWPTLLWQFTLACIKMGRPELARKALEVAEKRLSDDWWPEYYDTRTGRFNHVLFGHGQLQGGGKKFSRHAAGSQVLV
ncbi:hypothetical protein AAC387_Pa10g2066 [Persea americana]